MKSKAQIKGHPLHPILVSFPIAFLIGTLLFDVAGLMLEQANLHHTAFYLEGAGIAFALLAAVPGIVDYVYTVPPKSSGKKRAAKHGLINVTMVVIFFTAWIMRQKDDITWPLIISFESLGVILLFISGWLGGTLVYRNQIGVDLRYANAGKWNEETLRSSTGPFMVATSDELKTDQMKLLHIDHKRIVLGRTEDGYFAFDDRCTHRGGSLAGGTLICGTVQCPWHGSQFLIHNGDVKAGPAKEKIKTYQVHESDGKVFINIP